MWSTAPMNNDDPSSMLAPGPPPAKSGPAIAINIKQHASCGPINWSHTLVNKKLRTESNNNNNNEWQCLWCCHRDSVTARVHPVHLMNADQRQCQAAADPHTRPTDLGCESACRLLYCLHTSSPFIITQRESYTHFTVPRRVEGWVNLGTQHAAVYNIII